MAGQITRKTAHALRGLYRRNWMVFPRELRRAISDLHSARALEIDSLKGQSANTPLFGPVVELKLVVKETGKLSGEFQILMGLQSDAARQLGATLVELANQADKGEPAA